MQLLNTKTTDELSEEAIKQLRSIGFSTRPGSIAKLFLNIVNKFIGDFYTTLTVNHLRAFLTTSDGDALNAIGVLLSCQRLSEESDDNYRYRLSKQCLTLATSNKTAVTLSCLTVDGVIDVYLRDYSMGSGTFSVIVLTDPEKDQEDILKKVKDAIDKTRAYGVRYDVITPTFVPVKLKYILYINDSVSDVKKQDIKYKVQENLITYISSLTIGETLYIEKLNQIIMNTAPEIMSLANLDYKIGNEKMLYVNQDLNWMQQFTVSQDSDSIVIL